MNRSRDPRALLLAFGLLWPVVLSADLLSIDWWIACGMVLGAIRAVSLSGRELGRGLFRLRWLFLALLLTHALLTPGEIIGFGVTWVTWEGVLAGCNQALRLLLFVAMALALGRLATPMALASGLGFYLGWLERFRIPVRRGLSILAFCLTGLTRFQEQALRVRQEMQRRDGGRVSGRIERLERLAFGAAALLRGLLIDLRRREEGLRVLGFDRLPALPDGAGCGTGGRDWIWSLPPALLWLAWLG
ncbi:MAG: hypothetical protein HQL97_12240, partial [Magnetococcales bacterium]|nr:hypothetical protein [Magnetococcales bacterium]